MTTRTKVEWLVSVGGGISGPRPFDSEADALTYYEAEMAIPSYMGAGHKRQGSVTKVTTISEVIRPTPRLIDTLNAASAKVAENPERAAEIRANWTAGGGAHGPAASTTSAQVRLLLQPVVRWGQAVRLL